MNSVVKGVAENEVVLWRDCFPVPTAQSHKYSRGSALLRGGGVMTGAARLAARAAQRVGAGLVTIAAPPHVLPIYAQSLESVIVKPSEGLADWKALLDDPRYMSVLVGPGLGLGDVQKEEILTTLATQKPCVLDADALTAFADHPDILFEKLHGLCVLTPHEGEFTRLFGAADDDRIEKTRKAAVLAKCTVLLKGSDTVIATPGGKVVINRNAPPWLATGGSGDVLSGMILGLVTQKMPVFDAACAAVWLHGSVAAAHGPGLIAEDIVAGIPPILKTLLDR